MEVDEVRETSERGVEIEIERVYYVAKKKSLQWANGFYGCFDYLQALLNIYLSLG